MKAVTAWLSDGWELFSVLVVVREAQEELKPVRTKHNTSVSKCPISQPLGVLLIVMWNGSVTAQEIPTPNLRTIISTRVDFENY